MSKQKRLFSLPYTSSPHERCLLYSDVYIPNPEKVPVSFLWVIGPFLTRSIEDALTTPVIGIPLKTSWNQGMVNVS